MNTPLEIPELLPPVSCNDESDDLLPSALYATSLEENDKYTDTDEFETGWFDDDDDSDSCSGFGLVNPASGLPMAGCSGIDVGGNAFGTSNNWD